MWDKPPMGSNGLRRLVAFCDRCGVESIPITDVEMWRRRDKLHKMLKGHHLEWRYVD